MEVLIVALFAFVLGLAFCFWGYRVFLVLLPIWGFFAGLWLGATAVTQIFGDAFLATATGLVVGFITGLIFAVLSYFFYMIGVALVAGAVGAAIVQGFMGLFGLDSGLILFLLSLVGAVVVIGITFLFNLQKYVIIVLTAVAGANGLLLSVLLILGRVNLDDLQAAGNAIGPVLQDSWFWALAWLVIAGLGIYFQIITNRTYVFSKETYVEGWG